MNNFGNFLWKLFSATMVFFCHVGVDNAFAEDEEVITSYVDGDSKITSKYFVSKSELEDANRTSVTHELCKSGEYLSSCGAAVIGTNWLKGMRKTGSAATPNYFSYNTQSNDTINMENLKKFFAHQESLTYTSQTSSSTSDGKVYANNTASPSEYKTYLYQILSNYCTNDEGKPANIYCQPCPNNAYVERSTVQKDTYDTTGTGNILWDSWNVHTIADCYMNEFSDETGNYVYVANNSSNNTAKINCYYSRNVFGTDLSKLYY
jgi:hypothetical protein